MMVDWLQMAHVRFAEPYFRETVEREKARAGDSLMLRTSSVDVLESLAGSDPGVAPAGFIFHASRSGSTLLAQMFAASDANRVLSEPEPIDDVLRTGIRHPLFDEEVRVTWLRAVVSALSGIRGSERRVFIKFDAWHVLALPLVRRAFPRVPWVFVFRDPLEILVSQGRSFGSQFVVGPLPPEVFGLDLRTAATTPRITYAAHVLDQLLRAAEAHLDDAGRLVDYAELPGVLDAVLSHFGVHAGCGERAEMGGAAVFDAKAPRRRFQPDSADKRAAADDATRAAADRVRPTYERLLALRPAGAGG